MYILPALQQSNVIYHFSCHCNILYVGCTSQRLHDRTKQMFPNLSALALFPRNTFFFPISANLPPSLLLLIQPFNFIFYKIQSVLNIVMTVDTLFLPRTPLLSIYLLLKPLSSKLLILPSADKKN